LAAESQEARRRGGASRAPTGIGKDRVSLGAHSGTLFDSGGTMTIYGTVKAALLAAALGGAPAAMAGGAGAPAPAYSWSGFYVGGQIGYQWGQSAGGRYYIIATGVGSPLANYNDQGVAGGAHFGYNWQASQFVFGLEGDINGANYSGSILSEANDIEATRIGIEGSARGRVGVAWDRALIFGTGGLALASIESAFTCAGCSGVASESVSTGRVGWTAGGGVEYALTDKWSVRAEYRYSDYGRLTYSLAQLTEGAGYNATKRITNNLATVGFSYKF
jgi:outer membrane immunogenic protein